MLWGVSTTARATISGGRLFALYLRRGAFRAAPDKASTIRETPLALCLYLVTFASRFIFGEKRTAGAPLAFCRFAVVPLRGGRPFYTTRKAARRALPSSVRLIW